MSRRRNRPEDNLMTARDIAEFFSVSVRTVNRWRRLGLIPAIELPSGSVRYNRDEVEEVLVHRNADVQCA